MNKEISLITFLDILTDIVNGHVDEFNPENTTLPVLLNKIDQYDFNDLDYKLWQKYSRNIKYIVGEMDKCASFAKVTKNKIRSINKLHKKS